MCHCITTTPKAAIDWDAPCKYCGDEPVLFTLYGNYCTGDQWTYFTDDPHSDCYGAEPSDYLAGHCCQHCPYVPPPPYSDPMATARYREVHSFAVKHGGGQGP